MSRTSPLGELPDGWAVAQLADLTRKIGSGATPRGGASTYLAQRHNYALVRSQCVHDRSFDVEALSFLSDQQAAGLKGVELQPGDVLLNITGDGATFGRCCQVPSAALPAVVNQHVSIIRSKPSLLDPGYLLAYLVHPEIKAYVEGFNAGGSRRAITKGHIESFEIALPPIATQREIAATLAVLDHKIELNRKTAATLEEMARALYRSWFVDFDPVRARAEGRAPAHMDAATAELFPASFGENGLPAGWSQGALSDLALLNPTAHSKKSHPTSVEYVDLANTKWGRIDATTEYEWDAAPSRARLILRAGDTIVGTVRPGNGSYSYIGRDGLTGSTGFAVLRPKASSDSALVYLAVTDAETIDDLANLADGGAYPAVRPDVVASRPACLAPSDVRTAFSVIVSPLIERIEAMKTESTTLATLRDTLLPRLMSGELRVSAAREQIEKAA